MCVLFSLNCKSIIISPCGNLSILICFLNFLTRFWLLCKRNNADFDLKILEKREIKWKFPFVKVLVPLKCDVARSLQCVWNGTFRYNQCCQIAKIFNYSLIISISIYLEYFLVKNFELRKTYGKNRIKLHNNLNNNSCL